MKHGVICTDMFTPKMIETGVLIIHNSPLHDVKVGVWCAVGAKQITGLIFYMETIVVGM